MPMTSSVIYRDLDASQALNTTISKKLEKLSRYSQYIQGSKVTLLRPHQHHQKGRIYRAQIELDVKGKPILVSNDNESIHLAVKEAFASAERKLKETSAIFRTSQH